MESAKRKFFLLLCFFLFFIVFFFSWSFLHFLFGFFFMIFLSFFPPFFFVFLRFSLYYLNLSYISSKILNTIALSLGMFGVCFCQEETRYLIELSSAAKTARPVSFRHVLSRPMSAGPPYNCPDIKCCGCQRPLAPSDPAPAPDFTLCPFWPGPQSIRSRRSTIK